MSWVKVMTETHSVNWLAERERHKAALNWAYYQGLIDRRQKKHVLQYWIDIDRYNHRNRYYLLYSPHWMDREALAVHIIDTAVTHWEKQNV